MTAVEIITALQIAAVVAALSSIYFAFISTGDSWTISNLRRWLAKRRGK